MVNNADSFLNSLNKSQPKRKDVPTLERILPVIARDMNVMKSNMVKLVSIQGGTPKTKADQFFSKAESRENALEANYKKGSSPSRASGPGIVSRVGKGLGFGSNTSIKDFVGNILKFVIKGGLASLGVMGISKLLENDDIKGSIKDFIKNLFVSVLNIIKSGAEMISSIMKDDDGKIKEGIIGAFVAIKDLLVQSIKNIGELLSDPRVMKGIVDIVFAISDAIKKIFEAEIDLSEYGMGKTSLGKILADMALAFGAVYTAALIAAGALRQVGANLVGGGGGAAASAAGAVLPGIATAASVAAGTFVAYEALTAADRQRAKSDAEEKARKAGKSPQEVAKAGQEAYDKAGENQNQEFLGAMDESSMGSAIMEASGGKRESGAITNPKQSGYRSNANQARLKAEQGQPTASIGNQSFPTNSPTQAGKDYSKEDSAIQTAQSYLGKELSPKEWDMLLRATYAEGSGKSTEEYANIMAVILNRARNSGKSITDILYEKNQFQAVTGTKANGNKPSERFLKGPGSKDRKMMLEGTSLLSSIPAGQDSFTAADPNAYKEGTNINQLNKVKAAGGNTIGGTIFASNMYGSGKGMKPGTAPGETSPVLASASGVAPSSGVTTETTKSKSMLSTLLDDMTEQLAALDQMMGGKLGIDSIGLQTAFRQMDKEFMNNPTFVDSSTNVSNASAPAPGTAVSASVWDSQMTSLFVDRVAS